MTSTAHEDQFLPHPDDVAQAQPKRRPYNASASLSEYGVFPECDAAPVAQPAASAEPSDALSENEWYDLAQRHATRDWNGNGYMAAIQAVCLDFLSRYGRPAGDALPIRLEHMAVADEDGLRWMSGRKMPAGVESVELYAVPGYGKAPKFVYTAPVSAQKADDARDAVLPEAPTDALLIACGWEQWRPEGVHVDRGEATRRYRAIREAAIAQQRKGEGGEGCA